MTIKRLVTIKDDNNYYLLRTINMMNGNGEEKWNNTPQLIWIRHDCILKTYTYFVQIYLHDPFGSYPVPMSHEIWSGQEVATQATAVTATATASRFGQNEVRNAQWQNESLWTAGVRKCLDHLGSIFYQFLSDKATCPSLEIPIMTITPWW